MNASEPLTEMLRITGRIDLINIYLRHLNSGKTSIGFTLPGTAQNIIISLSPEGINAVREELLKALTNYEKRYIELKSTL